VSAEERGGLAYLDEGPRDADVVLLLHGWPTSPFLWRRLTPLLTLDGVDLGAACEALRELTEHPWPLRPVRQLRLERWGEQPIRGSNAEAPLRALGFSLSPKGLEL
jgi:hypothetical protein